MRLIENSNTRKLYSSLTEESQLNNDDEDFKDAVIRDFITYLDDVYGVETLEDAERVRKNVTNDDVNDYFTSSFYDILDYDDFDAANVAEEIIRREFHVPDTSNEQDNDANSTAEETDNLEEYNESTKLEEAKKPKNEEFPLNKDDEGFNETVLRDFRLFLMDKYGDELYQDATDEDVNEYFTGMFYDIWDNDDLDTANAAEDIIRAEYHVPDKSDFNESEDSERILAKLVKDLPDAVEYKGKTYQAFNVMSNDTTGATSKVYYCNMENTPNGDPQESNDYFFVVATLKKTDRGYKGVDHINYVEDLTEGVKVRESAKELFAYENGVKPEDIEERLEYRETMNESVKNKKSTKNQQKEDKRVVMQQGNITCFKENDSTYYVFENESDNEVEYDNEEAAMQDFLERVGIDPNNELTESVKLNEAGEWDDYDEDNIASKNNLTDVAKYIADNVPGGYYKDARGFDAYQGPYAYVKSDLTGGELWYGETNELFQLETGYGWILGDKDELVKALSDKDYLLKLVEETKKYIEANE